MSGKVGGWVEFGLKEQGFIPGCSYLYTGLSLSDKIGFSGSSRARRLAKREKGKSKPRPRVMAEFALGSPSREMLTGAMRMYLSRPAA